MNILVALGMVIAFTATAFAQTTPAVGTERLAWDQAPTPYLPTELTYAVYVDGVRHPLTATCTAPVAPATAYDCTAPLPAMTPGEHALQVVAIKTDQALSVESARSVVLNVRIIVAPATPANPVIRK